MALAPPAFAMSAGGVCFLCCNNVGPLHECDLQCVGGAAIPLHRSAIAL